MSYPCFFLEGRPLRQLESEAAVQASKLPWPWLNTKSSEMLKWQFVVLSAKHSKMLRFCYYTVKLEDVWNKSSQKQKQKKKLIVATLRGYQRMGIRHSPRIVSVKYSPYDCCLERSTNYEMEKKIEKYGTLESSALLYFSKVSSSSACLMEAGWNTTSSGFVTRFLSRVGWVEIEKEAALGYNHLVPSA